MVEYGQGVGQAGQIAGGGHPPAGGPTDVGSAAVASLTDALNHASAALGVPSGLLLLGAVVIVLFVGWFVFAR